MTATWDLYAKDLLRERPQDFVELILPGARYIARRESQFQMREIRLDRLIEVEYCERRMLLNLELQASRDPRMGIRLLRYSLAALEEYDLPVLSCVIYLQHVAELSEPPLCWEIFEGRRVLWFDFVCIQLAEMTIEELRQTNLLGLLPLFILSKDGKNFTVLDEIVTRLHEGNERELLALTRLFAELVFISDTDRTQVVRRFAMLQNIEDTPTYKRLVQQGRIEGRVEGARQIVVHLVQARFPSLRSLAEKQFATITDLEKLQEISLEISTARLARDARKYLAKLAQEDPQQ